MIEKVHQLKKNVILCKTVPNDLEKFQQCVPCPPKNGVILPDVCQFTYNTSPPQLTPREKYPLPLNTTPATFSRVPCVIWELFRRMVYMYVPLYGNVHCFPYFPLFFPFLLLERKKKIKSYDIKNCYLLSPIMKKIMPTQSKSKTVAWNHLWFYLTLSINPFMLLCTTMYWKKLE